MSAKHARRGTALTACAYCGQPFGACAQSGTCARLCSSDARSYVAVDGKALADPVDFWRSLSPAQALALLKAAPRVAGEWTSVSSYRWKRQRLLVSAVTLDAAAIAQESVLGGFMSWSCEGVWRNEHPTLAEAQSAADAALIAAGWLLVDDPRKAGA